MYKNGFFRYTKSGFSLNLDTKKNKNKELYFHAYIKKMKEKKSEFWIQLQPYIKKMAEIKTFPHTLSAKRLYEGEIINTSRELGFYEILLSVFLFCLSIFFLSLFPCVKTAAYS